MTTVAAARRSSPPTTRPAFLHHDEAEPLVGDCGAPLGGDNDAGNGVLRCEEPTYAAYGSPSAEAYPSADPALLGQQPEAAHELRAGACRSSFATDSQAPSFAGCGRRE
jgi:hypothetical protein